MKTEKQPPHWSVSEVTEEEDAAYAREIDLILAASTLMARRTAHFAPSLWVSMIAAELAQHADNMPESTAEMLRGVAAHLFDGELQDQAASRKNIIH